MFKDAKVGDRVFDYTLQEWGEIVSITNLRPYTILVKFEYGTMGSYTVQGIKNSIDKLPTLFWDEINPIIPPEKPLPDLDVDTPVLVWRDNGLYKYKRYFSHFDYNGNIYCFEWGATSWSADGKPTPWKYWELAK